MRKLYNIRGYHGSGKSTIPIELIKEYGSEEIFKENKVVATRVESLNLILVGSYHNACGGADGIKSKKELFLLLKWLINSFNENILLEGIFISNSEKDYLNFFRYLLRKCSIEPIIIIMNTPPYLCKYNVEQRRNGKLKFDKPTYQHILNGYFVFKKFFKCYLINNSENTDKEELLNQFKRIIKTENT